VAPPVPADGSALPVHLLRGRQVLHVQGAAAVTQAGHDGARAFLARDIGGRAVALFGEDALDGAAHGLGRDAELARPGGDQLVKGIGLGVVVRGDRIVGIGRRAAGAGAQAGGQGAGGGEAEAGADQLAAVHGRGSRLRTVRPSSRAWPTVRAFYGSLGALRLTEDCLAAEVPAARVSGRRIYLSSGAQRSAGLGGGGHHLGRQGLDLGLGQGGGARLDLDLDGDRLLALGHALAAIDVEHADIDDQRLVGARHGAGQFAHGLGLVHQEGEVAGQGHQVGQIRRAARLAALAARFRHRVEGDLEGQHGAVGVQRLQHARVQGAELDDDVLGPQLQPGGAAGVPPVAVPPLRQLQGADRGADLLQHGQQVALQGEQGVFIRSAPVPVGVRRDQPGDDRALAVRLIVQIDGADLEQGDIGVAARGVARRRLDQVRQGRGPHAVQISRDGVLQHQPLIAAAEQGRDRLLGEGPGDGLGIAQGRQGATGRAHPRLTRAEHPAGGRCDGRQGRIRQRGVALDAGDLLDQIGRALNIAAPGRRRHRPGRTAHDGEAQGEQDLEDPVVAEVHARQALHIGRIKGEGGRGGRSLSRYRDRRRLAAAQVQDQLRRQLQPRHDRGRVDAARKAVLGVRVDPQRAPGLGRGDGVEPGAFHEHVDGLVRAAGRDAAHDAAQADGALAPGVGDDAVGGARRIGLAVQRLDLISLAATGADDDPRRCHIVEELRRAGEADAQEVAVDELAVLERDRARDALRTHRRQHQVARIALGVAHVAAVEVAAFQRQQDGRPFHQTVLEAAVLDDGQAGARRLHEQLRQPHVLADIGGAGAERFEGDGGVSHWVIFQKPEGGERRRIRRRQASPLRLRLGACAEQTLLHVVQRLLGAGKGHLHEAAAHEAAVGHADRPGDHRAARVQQQGARVLGHAHVAAVEGGAVHDRHHRRAFDQAFGEGLAVDEDLSGVHVMHGQRRQPNGFLLKRGAGDDLAAQFFFGRHL
uniref:PE-PGRS family protein n=1 Tax=Parastrongyloides trichosuri TaxID=131310 RepID=A0A0N5A6U2_PARTI